MVAIDREQAGGAGSGVDGLIPKVTGAQAWVSIPCKFADIANEPRPPGYFQDIYGSDYPGLDHYWQELSYNQINLLGSSAASQWFTLPRPRSYYVHDMDGDGQDDLDLRRAAFDCTAAADSSINFAPFVGINLMFNADLDGFAHGGSSPSMNLDGVWDNWRMTWEPVWGYNNLNVLAHEMGHGFGLPHSSGMYGRTYDNVWDVMSHSECFWWQPPSPHPIYGCLGQHTIAYYKDRLGWVGARGTAVALGEERTLTLEQLALPPTGNFLLAKVPIADIIVREHPYRTYCEQETL